MRKDVPGGVRVKGRALQAENTVGKGTRHERLRRVLRIISPVIPEVWGDGSGRN